MSRMPMGRLSAGMMKVGGRTPTTKRMAIAPDGDPESVHAARIEAFLAEARAEMGYDRPGFIRVEHPDDMVPGTIMGRYRERIPRIGE